jgi:hypothetical protein
MKDLGPLGVLLDLAYVVLSVLVVCWFVGVFWLAIQALLPLWPLLGLLGAGAVYLYRSKKGGV